MIDPSSVDTLPDDGEEGERTMSSETGHVPFREGEGITAATPPPSLPLSEQYRISAKRWVELDSAANLLEETKSAVLSQRMKALGDMPVSRAELEVKASGEWSDYVTQMVKAREASNLAKVKLEWIRMKFAEWNSVTATRRAEMKL